MIKNTMEKFVEQHMDSVIKMYPKCCKCDRCKQDIMVLALNHLPPKYVSSDKGEMFMRLDTSDIVREAEIIREIAKAIEIVAINPRHNQT